MTSVYKLVSGLSWRLGALSLILGFLVKLVMPLGTKVFGSVTAHSLLFFAGILFLCTFATWTMEERAATKP
jgi:hypothetical protein